MQRCAKIGLLVLLACQWSVAAASDSVLDEIIVDFELVKRDGEHVRYEEFEGKNVLIAFGFTHCAHICPMIAANMSRALKVSDKEALGIFVSVDTERDTPEITDNYAGSFGDDMVGLSGSHQQVSAAAKNFNVTFVVTKSEDNYTVQHTPSIFLIGPDGQVIDVFAMNTPAGDIAAAMK
jgi:protein SCO1/2